MPDTETTYKVLIVEDNDAIKELAVTMFEMAGLAVLEARDAASGIDTFMQNADVDLVFSDLILPGGMTGIEMAKVILKESPEMLFLLATGYIDKGEALRDKIGKLDNVAVIAKPYDVTAVAAQAVDMIERQRSVN